MKHFESKVYKKLCEQEMNFDENHLLKQTFGWNVSKSDYH
jgi:hypothetical protein